MIHRIPKAIVATVTDMLANNQHVMAEFSWSGNGTYSRANQSISLHNGEGWKVFLVARDDETCTVMGAENIPPRQEEIESSDEQEQEWAREAIAALVESI